MWCRGSRLWDMVSPHLHPHPLDVIEQMKSRISIHSHVGQQSGPGFLLLYTHTPIPKGGVGVNEEKAWLTQHFHVNFHTTHTPPGCVVIPSWSHDNNADQDQQQIADLLVSDSKGEPINEDLCWQFDAPDANHDFWGQNSNQWCVYGLWIHGIWIHCATRWQAW